MRWLDGITGAVNALTPLALAATASRSSILVATPQPPPVVRLDDEGDLGPARPGDHVGGVGEDPLLGAAVATSARPSEPSMSVDQPAAQSRSTAPKKRKPIAPCRSPCRKASIAGLSLRVWSGGRGFRPAVPEGDVDGRGIEGLCARVAVAEGAHVPPGNALAHPPIAWMLPHRVAASIRETPHRAGRSAPPSPRRGRLVAPARASRRRPRTSRGNPEQGRSVCIGCHDGGRGGDHPAEADSSSASIEK